MSFISHQHHTNGIDKMIKKDGIMGTYGNCKICGNYGLLNNDKLCRSCK